MKIKCPDGSVKTAEECLACQECFPPVVKRSLLARHDRKKTKKEKPAFGISRLVSGCLRRSYYELVIEVPKSLEKLWIFSRGSAIHSFFQKGLEWGKEREIFRKIELPAFDLIGYIDAIYDGVLYEFKTTGNVPEFPQQHHVLQAQGYFSTLSPEEQEKIKKIIIVYASLQKIKHFEVPKRNILPFLEAQGVKLAQALKNQAPPTKEASWQCEYCDFRDVCEGKKNIDVIQKQLDV